MRANRIISTVALNPFLIEAQTNWASCYYRVSCGDWQDRKGKTAAVLKSRTRKRRYSRLFLRLLCRHGLDFVQRNEIRGIDAGIARRAIGRLLSFGASLAQAFQREIRQRVGANVVADFFHRFIGSDKLV